MIAPCAVLGLRNRFRYPFPGSPSVFKTDRDSFAIPHKAIENGSHRRDRILMTREERRVMPRTCFSVEPGIYLPEFGIRSEVNVFVDASGGVHVTGGDPQTFVPALLG